jgi:hypothetical protein
MVAIFPYLDTYFCIATKWSRNLGFLITYSALLMKTWRQVRLTRVPDSAVVKACFCCVSRRVSLTFRVKSAHKLKLTDKQLLQWLFPIHLVMVIYLSAWTLSDPPQASRALCSFSALLFHAKTLRRPFSLRIMQDSSSSSATTAGGTTVWLWVSAISHGQYMQERDTGKSNLRCNMPALGELLFLLWGIKICFDVRKARTYFDEAKLIRWSIYNIALVNILMLAIQ